MRVVLDTTVLVAAARSRQGASHALLSLLPSPAYEPVISVPLFLERSAAQIEGFLDFLLSASHLQEIFFLWRPALSDPDDDLILELAVAAECRYIVSHNLRDFRGIDRWGITAISPADLLNLIKTTP